MEADVGQKLDLGRAWVVCLSAAMFFFYIFIQLNFFNAIEPSLFKVFGSNASQMAFLSQMYFYGNVLFLFPAGLILDRLSTRKVLLWATSTCIISTWWFARAHSYGQAEIARFIIGASGSFCLLAPVRLASRWFPSHKMAAVVGVIVTMAMLGGWVAQAPFTFMADNFGCSKALYTDVVLGVVIFFGIFATVQDAPPGASNGMANSGHSSSSIGLWCGISKVVRNPQNILAGLYASIINLPVFWLGFWGGNYLIQAHNLPRELAASINGMVFFGMIVGSPLFGWWSDKIMRRKLPMIVGAIASFVVMMAIVWMPGLGRGSLFVLYFLLGIVISSQVIAYPLVVESNSLDLTGTAESMASVLIMSGGFTLSLLTVALSWHWSGKLAGQVPYYSLGDYHFALSLLPASFIIALLISLLLKETHCKPYQGE